MDSLTSIQEIKKNNAPAVPDKTDIDMLDLNNLLYDFSVPFGLSVNRTQKKHYAKNTVYTSNKTLEVTLQGSDFIDPAHSYLKFKLKLLGTTPVANLSVWGSAINCFREVRIISNGKKLSTLTSANLFQYYQIIYKSEPDWLLQNGSTLFQLGVQGAKQIASDDVDIIVPLKFISPFFTGKLLPPQLTEGLTIQIVLEDVKTAFKSVSGTIDDFQITDPIIVTDNYIMNSDTKLLILSMNPLLYEFENVSHSQCVTSESSNEFFCDHTHALANALEVFAVARNDSNISNLAVDSFNGIGVEDGDRYLFRSGSNRLPSDYVTGVLEAYQQVLYAYNKTNNKPSYPDGSDFEFDIPMYVANLRRSNLDNTSGREVSNTSSLILEGIVETPLARVVDMFVTHLTRVYVNSKNTKGSKSTLVITVEE